MLVIHIERLAQTGSSLLSLAGADHVFFDAAR